MATSTLSLLESLTPISQGAEAKVYRYALHGPGHAPLLIKYRFAKKYRHGTLDAALTRARTASEARMLLRCLRNGVHVPGVRMVDATAGVLGLEWVTGRSVRALLGGGEEIDEGDSEFSDLNNEDPQNSLAVHGTTIDGIMRMMGVEIAKMHLIDVVHGDLTTSNMMLRQLPLCSPELVLIDFGLSFVSNLVEDKAVDLYVLERAFASTHPDSEPLFAAMLEAYASRSDKAWGAISKRLDAVRLRGRKRSMVG